MIGGPASEARVLKGGVDSSVKVKATKTRRTLDCFFGMKFSRIPSYVGIFFIHHETRNPYETTRMQMESKIFFFVAKKYHHFLHASLLLEGIKLDALKQNGDFWNHNIQMG